MLGHRESAGEAGAGREASTLSRGRGRKKGMKVGESGISHRQVPEGRLSREVVVLFLAQETFFCLISHLRLQERPP